MLFEHEFIILPVANFFENFQSPDDRGQLLKNAKKTENSDRR